MTLSTPRLGRRPLLSLVVVVGSLTAAAAFAASFAPDNVHTLAMAGAAAVVGASSAALAARMFILETTNDSTREANERVAASRRELFEERTERSVIRELDRGLDQAANEREAVDLVREAFVRHLAGRTIELHLVDAVDPVLTLTIASGDHPTKPGDRTSPWESLAARTNTTLVYESTDRLDVCSHVKSRLFKPAAVVAIPLNATGRLLGVLYLFDREGELFDPKVTAFVEDLANVIASRIAVLRSASAGGRADAIDRLTGLPDRSAMQERVIRLLEDRQSFTVAVADIDGFGALNGSEGREAGDRALQTMARVSRRTIRPEDIVGRIGGDELLFVLPRTAPDDATRALERLREELVLAQSASSDAPFTVSIGVIGSSTGGTIEEILHRAAGALNHAKTQGGNRVVVAQPAPQKDV